MATVLQRAGRRGYGDTWAHDTAPAPAVGRPEVSIIDDDEDRDGALWRNALPVLVLLAGFDAATSVHGVLAASLYATLFVLVAPGACLLAALRFAPAAAATRLAASIGVSALLLMAWGAATSGATGFSSLAWAPLVLLVNVVVVVAGLLAARRADPLTSLLGTTLPARRDVLLAALLAALPVAAAAGANLLNNRSGGTVAALTYAVSGLVLIGVFVTAERLPSWLPGAAVFAAGLALLYAYSLRGGTVFGAGLAQEHLVGVETYLRGRWVVPTGSDPVASMLSVTVLPAALAAVAHLPVATVLRVVFPAVMALFPVLAYGVARRWLTPSVAVAVPVLMCLLPEFATTMATLGRQEIGLLYFGLLVVLICEPDARSWRGQTAVAVALAGLTVSDYAAAYVAAGMLAGTWVLFMAAKLTGRYLRVSGRRPVVTLLTVVIGLGLIVGWDYQVTHSTHNVSALVSAERAHGPEIRVAPAGVPVVDAWLDVDPTRSVTAAEYYREATAYARLHGGATRADRAYPAVPAQIPTVTGRYPTLAGPLLVAEEVAEALLLGLSVLGVLGIIFPSRVRLGLIPLELGMAGLVFTVVWVAVRVSGTVAAVYSPAQADIQGVIVIGLGLAFVYDWFINWHRRLAIGAIAGAMAVLFVGTSGLATPVVGGSPAAALANAGLTYERYFITDQELAAAGWLGTHAPAGALVTVDAAGQLRLVAAGDTSLRTNDLLTPSTTPAGSWVYATTDDVSGVVIGELDGQALYAFPSSFLDRHDAVVYSNGTARIYK